MSDLDTAPTGAPAAPADTAPADTQAPSQDSAPANQDDAQQDTQPRDEKGRFVQQRINELTRQRYEAQRQAEQVARERDELRAELQRARQPAAPDPTQDFEGYVSHRAEAAARRIVEEQQGQWQQHQEQQRQNAIVQQYETRAADYAAANPGYHEAIDNFVQIAAGSPPEIAEVLMTSEHGPAVAQYLGEHLDEAVRVLRMPPHLAAAEIARIEARVSVPKSKPVSNAPNPPPKVGGASAAPRGLSDDLSMDEWMRRRTAKS